MKRRSTSARASGPDEAEGPARSGTGRLVALCLTIALSFLSGMADAVGLIAYGDFVSYMSGNTTRLAMALGQGELKSQAILLAGIILTFVLGNAFGALLARGPTGDGPGANFGGRQWIPLVAVSLLLCLMLGVAILAPEVDYAFLLPAALAMGVLNICVERLDGHPVGLTYVTAALARLGKGLGHRLLGWKVEGIWMQTLPWAGMIVGAVAGAFAVRVGTVFACAVLLALSVGLTMAFLMVPARLIRNHFQYG